MKTIEIQIINLFWEGPYSYDQILDMDGLSDYGIYQIYGTHSVYGSDTLLYIGRANDQTFKSRFSQSDRQHMDDIWSDNTVSIRIHTGRIHVLNGEEPLGNSEWGKQIDFAERLLIAANSPAYNAQGVWGLKEEETQYEDYLVLSWGAYGCLMPEVSGARHAWKIWKKLRDDPLKYIPDQT